MNETGYTRPPGTHYQILSRPSGVNAAMEVAIVQDHRFAFFYWWAWRTREKAPKNPPTLVSFDWHEDLGAPEDDEKKALRNLEGKDHEAVALFCWNQLNPANDGHILAAAYLNLIADIYVLRKQDSSSMDRFVGADGEPHSIRCHDSLEKLLGELASTDCDDVFFDIDLDYFTESDDPCGGGANVRLVSDEDIAANVTAGTPFMEWLHPRMSGFTIATEPEYCGGLRNSNKLLATVDSAMFEGGLLSQECKWKHL